MCQSPFVSPPPLRNRLGMWLRAFSWALACLGGLVGAAPLEPSQVPEPLKPWVPWVMHDAPEWQCPHSFDEAQRRFCAWPGVLQLAVDGRGGRFNQRWHGVREDWVALPGEGRWWPQEVLLDGKPVAVLDREGVPSVRLPAGEHRLEGQWRWSGMPESLALPKTAALLQLSLAGKPVGEPVRDEDNRVWLGRRQTEAGAEADQAQLRVYRQWQDGIPMRLQTRVHLEVSGRSRELTIARGLLPQWVPQELVSPLPATLAPDGSLRVQARAGVWELTLLARHPGQVSALGLPAAPPRPDSGTPPLVADEEVWTFAAAPQLRSVSLDGAPSVDPQQTTLPAEWRQLPAYLMGPEAVLSLKEQRRGDVDPASDKLALVRHAWLSFDGSTMTFHDRITGRVNQATRLELGAPAQLGRADVGGEDQLITLGSAGLTGLELRRGMLTLSADSLMPATRSGPAVGWRQDFDSVVMQLTLPAGWRLLHAGGADRADGAWLSRWNLLDFFVVLLLTLTVGRLWGVRLGAAAFVMVVLSYHEAEFPLLAWLPLLLAAALGRVVPDSLAQARRVIGWVERLSLGLLLLLCLQFTVSQVRTALYPVLEAKQDAVHDARLMDGSAAAQSDVAAPAPMAPLAGSADVRSRSVAASPPLAKSVPLQQQAYRNVDPQAKVQTGPGLPSWSWHNHQLQWDGPVLRDQPLTLWLLPPWGQRLLTVVRLALLGLLLVALVRRARPPGGSGQPAAAPAVGGWLGPLLCAGLFAGALAPSPAQAAQRAQTEAPPAAVAGVVTWPDATLLAELQRRLTQPPDCLPACAVLSRLSVQATGTSLSLVLEVDADRATAIPVPGGLKYWVPRDVRANGQPQALLRGDDERLWLPVAAGRQRIELLGELPAGDTLQLPLPLKPRRVQVHAPGWDAEGLGEDDEVADTFQLTRQRKAVAARVDAAASAASAASVAAGAERDALPAFLRVERRLYLDLVWRIETTVRRESPRGVPALAQVPLLQGEAVTSGGINIRDGKVQVNLGPQTDVVSWSSTLAPSSRLSLSAAAVADMPQTPWAETWWVDASTLWHVALQGVPPTSGDARQSQDVALAFHPWPGETLVLQVDRPQAVAGQTLTVDRAVWRVKPGARATDCELTLSLRSSRGLDHALTLPEGASLQQVTINGQPRALRPQGRVLTLPVVPGKQTVVLSWRSEQGMGLRYQAPSMALGLDSVNHQLSLAVPANRWLLWASGPGLGPAILFWGVLWVFLGVGLVLARVGRRRGVPLGTASWLLLMVGLTQVSPWACAVVVGWFFLVARRGDPACQAQAWVTRGPAWRFNLGQVGLVLATVLMLGVLCHAVAGGLLGRPDMQVSGNGATWNLLHWTQDRVGQELPPVTLITVPLMVYRGLMLAWALWLAWSLLSWLRWGWGAWSGGTLWRRKTVTPTSR